MQILLDSVWSKHDVWHDLAVSTSEASLQEVVVDLDLQKSAKSSVSCSHFAHIPHKRKSYCGDCAGTGTDCGNV